MTGASVADPGWGSEHCMTCGDVGDPMTVVAVDRGLGLATCSDDDGAQVTVETALVSPVETGERLLVHAGTAIARLALDAEAVRS